MGTTEWNSAPPYLSISKGKCTDHGYTTISSQATCVEAALQLGLPDHLAGVSRAGMECMVQDVGGTQSSTTKLCRRDPCLVYNSNYGFSADGSHCANAPLLGMYGSWDAVQQYTVWAVHHGTPLADVAACRAACLLQPGCEFYVFVLNKHLATYLRRSCWLKSAVSCPGGSEAYGYSPDIVSGHWLCQTSTSTNTSTSNLEGTLSLASGQSSTVQLVLYIFFPVCPCASFEITYVERIHEAVCGLHLLFDLACGS